MALIQCPECQHELSTFASACPHCGYPINEHASVKAVRDAVQAPSEANSPTINDRTPQVLAVQRTNEVPCDSTNASGQPKDKSVLQDMAKLASGDPQSRRNDILQANTAARHTGRRLLLMKAGLSMAGLALLVLGAGVLWHGTANQLAATRKPLSDTSSRQPQEKRRTRGEFFPDTSEYKSVTGYYAESDSPLLDRLFTSKETGQRRQNCFHKKIELIRQHTNEAIAVLTPQEVVEYQQFFAGSAQETAERINVRRLAPDIDWDAIVKADYGIYRQPIDFSYPSEFDKLVIFLHEKYYRDVNASDVEGTKKDKQVESGFREFYVPLKVGTSTIPLCVAYGRYFIEWNRIKDHAHFISNRVSEEDAWKMIVADVRENAIGLCARDYRKGISVAHLTKLTDNQKSVDRQFLQDMSRRFADSEEFVKEKTSLVALKNTTGIRKTLAETAGDVLIGTQLIIDLDKTVKETGGLGSLGGGVGIEGFNKAAAESLQRSFDRVNVRQ